MYFLNESSFRMLFRKGKWQITHLFNNNFIVSSRQYKNKIENEDKMKHMSFMKF